MSTRTVRANFRYNGVLTDTGILNQPTVGSTFDAFGDSVTYGIGASVPGNAYIPLLVAASGLTVANHGIVAQLSADQAAYVYAKTVTAASISTLLFVNDELYYSTAQQRDAYRQILLGEMSWLAIPAAQKILGTDTAHITYAGTWLTEIIYHLGKCSTTNGSTATVSVTGSAIVIGSIAFSLGSNTAGTFTLSVDGTVVGTYPSEFTGSITTPFNLSYAPYGIVIRGLSNTAHTVVITVTSPTAGNNPVYLNWIAGIDESVPQVGAYVYMANTFRQKAAGYISFGGSDANVALCNTLLAEDVALLASMGLNVSLVDLESLIDPAVDLISDGLHPNDLGHAKIARAFAVAIVGTAVLSDEDEVYGVKRNDTGAVVVAANTLMTRVATGQYEYTFTEPAAWLAYTAWVKFVYGGNTYYQEVDLPATAALPNVGTLYCSYTSLVNLLALEMGLHPGVGPDVITDGSADTVQATDILRCIRDGLSAVYNAYEWSYFQPRVQFTTLPCYSTGTVTIDGSGNVTGIGTVFPPYSASSSGWLQVGLAGAFPIKTYTSGTALVLDNWNGQAAITSPSTYSIWFNQYPMPDGIDSLKGPLEYAPSQWSGSRSELEKTTNLQIDRDLARYVQPGKPVKYCLDTATPDATVGSQRTIRLWPPPTSEFTLCGIGTVRPTMIDATHLYPIGVEVLGLAIQESCLAAWERNVERKDIRNPDAVHNAALPALLQQAIELDKRKAAPETLGVSGGSEGYGQAGLARIPIYLDIGGGIVGWFG
jgi:hypothetical protein